MAFDPTLSNPVSGGLSIIVGGISPQESQLSKIKKSPIWNDPAALAKHNEGLRAGSGGKFQSIRNTKDAINRRIAELNAQGPRIQPVPGEITPSPIFGGGVATETNVFGLPTAGAAPILGMTIPRGVKAIFGGTTSGKAIGAAKRAVTNIPKTIGRSGGTVGKIGMGTVAVMIGKQIIDDAVQVGIEEQERAAKEQAKIDKKAGEEAKARGTAARKAAGLPPLPKRLTEAQQAAAEARAARAAEAANKRYERAQENADKAMERARERGAKATERTTKIIEQAEQDLAKIGARPPAGMGKYPVLKVPPSPLAKLIFAGAGLLGTLVRQRIERNRVPGRRKNEVFTDDYSPDFGSVSGSDFTGADYSSLSFAAASATATGARTKAKTRACKSDAPKRKKGRCRSGYFRETPTKTTYKVWSERKCS